MFSLQNKTAIITGAGSGIGKVIALLFAKQGADVPIVDINHKMAMMTVNEIEQDGGHATASVGIPDRFAYSMSKGAVSAMTLSVAKDYLANNIRCNSIAPARVHTAFVDGFLTANYRGREAEMFEKLSKTQQIGRMAKAEEIACLALYPCSDEASFITACDYPIDGGFVKLNN